MCTSTRYQSLLRRSELATNHNLELDLWTQEKSLEAILKLFRARKQQLDKHLLYHLYRCCLKLIERILASCQQF